MPMPTGTFTDLYELRMVQSYLEHGVTGDAVFDLHVRSLPPGRGYLVAAGLTSALDALDDFTFTEEDLAYLREQGLSEELLDHLAGFEFTGTVRAVPEGRICFPYEPLLQVEAPLPQAQLVETVLLNAVHVETVLASKAARCRHAAGDRRVVDFGARRAHGRDAARAAARSAFLAGLDGTSLVSAAAELEIPCVGTMAHSYVQAFGDETEALASFARSFPDRTTLLIDTYDTLEGARTAVDVAERLADEGVEIGGVRLDSGDLGDLAREVRQILDEAGLDEVAIVASGGLDEHALARLRDAPIDAYGVGTALATSRDAPSLDLSYKLVAYDGEPTVKLSPGKETLPGKKQVHRRIEGGTMVGDTLSLLGEDADGEPLLETFAPGDLSDPDALHAGRERFLDEVATLPDDVKALDDPTTYPVERSSRLEATTETARRHAG